jgi:hypothetical protein
MRADTSVETIKRHKTGVERLMRLPMIAILISSLAMPLSTVPASSVMAAESGGCVAIGSGLLKADVSPSMPVTRTVALAAGDLIDFNAGAGAKAQMPPVEVALVSGPGAPQSLTANAAGAITFKAPEAGDYVFSIAAGSAPAAVALACTSSQTAAATSAFLARRKDLINAREPDRINIARTPAAPSNSQTPLANTVALDDKGNAREVQFSVSLSELAAAGHPGAKPDPGLVDLWVEGRMQNYEATIADTAGSGNVGVLYLGTRSMFGPDILFGGLAQLDRGIESANSGDSRLAATGWMAGPYVSMRLGSGITFDGRTAWGTTDNVAPGLALADTQTARRLVRAKLTSTRDVEGWKVAPSLGLYYIEDAMHDDATGETKAAGTGKVELLPEVSRRFQLGGDTYVEPRAAMGAFVGFDDLHTLKPALAAPSAADLRLKAEAGVAVGAKDGSSLAATGGVESGSATAAETWTGRLQLKVPLSN